MNRSLRIAIADADVKQATSIQNLLQQQGHCVSGIASDVKELVNTCCEFSPDLILLSARFFESAEEGLDSMWRAQTTPAILYGGVDCPVSDGMETSESIFGYLATPINESALEASVQIARRQSQKMRQLQDEVSKLEKSLSDRKIVEKAKGVLMSWTGLSEADAFRRMQKLARDRNRTLADVATMLLTLETQGTNGNGHAAELAVPQSRR